MRARRAVLAVLVAVAALTGLPGAQARPAPAAAPATLAVLGCPATGRTVPPGFLGLSVEWSMVPGWFGTGRTGAVASTVALLRSLSSRSGGPGVLRIGGDSQDGYVYSPAGPAAANTLFTGVVTPGMVDAVLEVARRSGWHVLLGVNVRENLVPNGVALARYAATHDPTRQLLGLELGNEPDAYNPDVRVFLARFRLYADALAADPLTRRLRLAGPAVSNAADLSWVTRLRTQDGPRLLTTTWHAYGNRPTLTRLLDQDVHDSWVRRLREAQDASAGLPTRMEEGNSVGGGGLPGVSDVTGVTAWVVDTALTAAQEGLAGYHLHAWDAAAFPLEGRRSAYTPFVVRDGRTAARPGYYALAALADVPGRRFCRVAGAAGPDGLRGWALLSPADGSLAVLLTRRSATAGAGSVRLGLPSDRSGTTATLTRLTDPGGCVGRAPRWGGASLTPTGTLSPRPEPVAVPASGQLVVTVGPCETVRLDVARSPGAGAPTPGR